MPLLAAILLRSAASALLTVVEQTMHTRHRPPPGVRHLEVPDRLIAAREALSDTNAVAHWRKAGEAVTHEEAKLAVERVHTAGHLQEVQRMSQRGGGFDTDTYCAPGSWDAMLDGTSAWLEATALAGQGAGPALALCRPAGHHATADVAMGFGLVNFAAAAVLNHLETHPADRVGILDWDVHHGNGVAAILGDEPRVRYASTHEAGGCGPDSQPAPWSGCSAQRSDHAAPAPPACRVVVTPTSAWLPFAAQLPRHGHGRGRARAVGQPAAPAAAQGRGRAGVPSGAATEGAALPARTRRRRRRRRAMARPA